MKTNGQLFEHDRSLLICNKAYSFVKIVMANWQNATEADSRFTINIPIPLRFGHKWQKVKYPTCSQLLGSHGN